jgi:hypothetical protein
MTIIFEAFYYNTHFIGETIFVRPRCMAREKCRATAGNPAEMRRLPFKFRPENCNF